MFLTADSELQDQECVYTHLRPNLLSLILSLSSSSLHLCVCVCVCVRTWGLTSSLSLLLLSLLLLLLSSSSSSLSSSSSSPPSLSSSSPPPPLLLLLLLLLLLHEDGHSCLRCCLPALLFGPSRHWWEGAPTHYHLEGKSERQRPMRWDTRHYHDSEDTSCFSTVGSVRGYTN